MMNRSNSFRNILELNVGLILIATSGPLGRYIDVPVPVTICSRAIIGGLLLLLFSRIKGYSFSLKRKDKLTTIFAGLLFGAHWITYFLALKMAGVAMGMLSLYTYPVMTVLLEPLVLKTKLNPIHIAMGFLVLFGIYFLAPEISFDSDAFVGICFGVLSALCFATRNLLIKGQINKYNQSVLMYYQLAAIAVALSPSFFLLDIGNVRNFIPQILTLSILTTAIGHTLFVFSLKKFSTTSASIMASMQPIYGTLLAMLFLNEYPSLKTAIGGAIIISTVFIEAGRTSSSKKQTS